MEFTKWEWYNKKPTHGWANDIFILSLSIFKCISKSPKLIEIFIFSLNIRYSILLKDQKKKKKKKRKAGW